MPEQIVVSTLESGPFDERVVAAVEDVCQRLAESSGMLMDYQGHEVLTSTVRRHSWVAEDRSLAIEAVDDAQADVWYLEVLSELSDLVDVVAADLHERLPTEDLDDTLAQIEGGIVNARTINRLGLLGREVADGRIVDALSLAMLSDQTDIRRAAVNAAGLLSWPELVDALDSMAAVEADPATRDMAERAAYLSRPPA